MISATIEQLLSIACKAIEHQKAKDATRHAKLLYHVSWSLFETGDDWRPNDEAFFVHPEERIGRGHPDFDQACMATKAEHDAYKAAKRAEYNAKRRLETAIRGVA